ncbi:TPA: phage tail protein, partial [Escherichia coli]|nr:phage tail protein [Escherichia coli]
NRLPIQVVKIPMAAPLKQAFDENVDRIRRERLPGELASALKQQLRIAIKR